MADSVDTLLVDVRANTQGFAADVAQMRGTFDGTLVEGFANAGNVLTGGVLDKLPLPEPGFAGVRIVYGEGCTVPDDRLARLGVTFKQIPYQIEGL